MNRIDSINIMREHYSRSDVQKEIIDFCRGRWVAIHYLGPSGNLILRRYISGRPMKAEDVEDLKKLCGCMRSIYATANVYRRIESLFDINDQGNVVYCTPTWDIDGNLSLWTATIRVARRIVEFLANWGIKESLYIKWSGNGCHVHLHERGISESLLEKYSPLNIGYAIVEYVNTKISHDLIKLSTAGEVKVENKMDPARIFTCPLSLHRKLDVVCICMKPEDLENFSPSWVSPEDFKHDPSWREFREGEVDKLAEAAYKAVGGYPLKPRRGKRKTKPLDKQIMEWLQRD